MWFLRTSVSPAVQRSRSDSLPAPPVRGIGKLALARHPALKQEKSRGANPPPPMVFPLVSFLLISL